MAELVDRDRPRLLILGAGVVGLSTAVQCQQRWPHADVIIMADKFGTETTSYGPGGIFRPTYAHLPGVEKERLRKWARDSWDHYHGLAHSGTVRDTGVQVVSFYQFYNTDNIKENDLEKENLYHYRKLTTKELSMFPGMETVGHGFFGTTLVAEGAFYTEYLMKRFLDGGGRVQKRKISRLSELVSECDVLFNCTGLGSRELVGDSEVVPIRGQLIKVRAPWIKHAVMFGDAQSCFIYPGRDLVAIGVTRQKGDFNTEASREDSMKMWTDALRIMPSLEKAEWVSEWVGLRPHRSCLRLEQETIRNRDGSELQVVHNYGHGGNGIALSWGTAKEAVDKAREILGGRVKGYRIHSRDTAARDRVKTSKL